MMHNKLHVSFGNDKIGKRTTMNVSLLPGITCPQGVSCLKECYARKLLYSKTAEHAWLNNTAFAMNDPLGFMDALKEKIAKRRPAFFRWHVAGDVPSEAYQEGMIKMARSFPETRFLVFTKWTCYQWPVPALPNLRVIFSSWKEVYLPDEWRLKELGFHGVAFVEGDPLAPKDAFKCSGTCDRCRECWDGEREALLLKKH
jgi:hypothetical protein